MDQPETNLGSSSAAPQSAAAAPPSVVDRPLDYPELHTHPEEVTAAEVTPSTTYVPLDAHHEFDAHREEATATAEAPPALEALTAPAPADAATSRKRHHGDVLTSIQSLAVTVVIAMFVITFVVQAFQIPSESMEDTLLIGDYLLVDKVHFAHGGIWGEILPYHQIRRGDIVVFRYPVHPQQHFVKRVIGLPGDHIQLKNKRVYVNGRPLRENYVVYRSSVRDPYRDDFPKTDYLNANVEALWWLQMRTLVKNGELTVPPGQYFVLGDNRDESLDSRYWGFVPQENIIGRPLVIYWSMRHPDRIGPLAESASDKVLYFAYNLTHMFQEARWNRAFRLIK